MRKMNLCNSNQYDASRIIGELTRLDCALTADASIQLCGSASVLLQGVDFRKTMDIDFATMPGQTVLRTIETVWPGRHLFDVNATGIIGLLIDYDDRLVDVDLDFSHLRVQCISKRDWIVSKLASPKVDDVLSRSDVTVEDLLWIREHMDNYGGVSFDRAHSDLSMLLRELEQR